MLKSIFTGTVISAMLTTSAFGHCRPKDSFVTYLNDVAITMNDPEAGWQDLVLYEAGATCFTHQLGTINKLGSLGEVVLVEYKPSRKTSMRECPYGTQYLIPRSEWNEDCKADTNLYYQELIRNKILGK